MAKFKVTAPDGQTYTVTAPDDATPEQVRDYVRQQVEGGQQAAPEPAPPKSRIDAAREAVAGETPFNRNVGTFVRGAVGAIPFANDAGALFDAAIGRGDGETFGDRYSEALDKRRGIAEADRADRPALSYGGLAVGATMLPFTRVAAAPTMGAKIKQGARIAGGYGALQGLSEGEGPEGRFVGGVTGGLLGLGLGAAAAPAATAIGKGAKKLFGPIVAAGRGVIDPAKEAARRVLGTIRKAHDEGRGLSPADLRAAQSADSPLVLGDIAGEPGRALARSAANTSPEGREALTEVVQNRFSEQAERTSSFIDNLVGGKVEPARLASWLQARARTKNAPLYATAEREAADNTAASADGLWNEELARLAQSPTISAAMRASVPRGADRAVAQGGAPAKSPFVVDDAGKVSLAPADEAGNRTLPNLRYWDNVKRELDAKAIELNKAGDKSGAATVKQLRAQLLKVLDGIAPTYKTARASAASFFGAEDALEAGQNFVGMTKSADLSKARDAVAKMTATERALFAQGYASELAESTRRIADNSNVPMRAVFNSPLARQKVEIALGARRAVELESFLTVERTMDRLRTALGNSTTARQLAELGIAGGVGGIATFAGDAQTGGAVGIGTYLLRMLAGRVDRRVAQRVAELLASDDPRLLRQAHEIISGSAPLRRAFNEVDDALVKIGGTFAGGEARVEK